MKKIYVLLIGCFALLSLSCEDERIIDPTYLGEGFTGITFTGEGPYGNGSIDPSDWCVIKMDREQLPNDSLEYALPNFSFGPAYPNPVYHSTVLRFDLPKRMYVKIYVIDNNYNIIKNIVDDYHHAGSYQVSLTFEDSVPGGVYRAVIEADGIKCTGDIWLYRPKH